jgi:hypothetical protein
MNLRRGPKDLDEPADTAICKFPSRKFEVGDHANQRHIDTHAQCCKQVGHRHTEFGQVHVCRHEHASHRRRPADRERAVYRRQIDYVNVLGNIQYIDSVEARVGAILRATSVSGFRGKRGDFDLSEFELFD